MPESFIPVWMSVSEAEEFRDWLASMDDFQEREHGILESALSRQRPRSYDEMQAERGLVVGGDGERREAAVLTVAAIYFDRAAGAIRERDPIKAGHFRDAADRLRSFIPDRLSDVGEGGCKHDWFVPPTIGVPASSGIRQEICRSCEAARPIGTGGER